MTNIHPRVARTRQLLGEALIRLGLEKGHDNLTAREVAREAGVSYPSFWRHFSSLDDLLAYVIREKLRALVAEIDQQEHLGAELIAMFVYIRDEHQLFRAFTNLPLGHPAREIVIDDMAGFIADRYQAKDECSVPLAISVTHLLESTFTMIRWYLDHLDETTPEQVASMYLDLVVKAAESTTVTLRDDWLKRNPHHQHDYEIPAKKSPPTS